MNDFRTENFLILDAVERNKQFPDTFLIPSSEEIESLEEGDFVKICFKFEPISGHNLPYPNAVEAERIWTEVSKITKDENGKIVDIVAFLENEPVFVKNISFRDLIIFGSENVLTIMKGKKK